MRGVTTIIITQNYRQWATLDFQGNQTELVRFVEVLL
jgi:hypothetical protein